MRSANRFQSVLICAGSPFPTRCYSSGAARRSALLLSKINVRDLAKGVSAPEAAQVSNLDQNWFQYLKSSVSPDTVRSPGIDLAAKDRIVRAQREAAFKELPPSMQRRMQQQQERGETAPPNAELPIFSTVQDTLNAADPLRTTRGSDSSRHEAGPEGAPAGEAPLASSLEGGAGGLSSSNAAGSSTPSVEPSLSISPSFTSVDAIVTPMQIRLMFKESVEARTVANTALRKYIKALSAGDYTLAVAAYDGCRAGGLRVDADTYCALLDLLLAAQQLKAGLELYQTMIRDRNPPNTSTYNSLMRLCLERGAVDATLRMYDEMPRKGRAYDRVSHEIAMSAIAKQDHPIDWQKAVQIFERATSGAVDNNGVSLSEAANTSITPGADGDEVDEVATPARRSRRRNLLELSGEGEGSADYVPGDKVKQVGGFTNGRHSAVNQATASTYNALMRVYLAMEPFEWRVVYNCYFEMRNSKPKVPINWESYRLVAEAMRRGEASRTRRVITYIDAWIQLTSIGSARFIMGFATYGLIIGLIKMVMSYYFTDKVEASQDVGLNVEHELPVGHETIAVGLGGKSTRAGK